MMLGLKRVSQSLAFAATLALLAGAEAVSASAINRDASDALAKFYQEVPAARKLAKQAKAVLICPSVVKGGLIVGGQYGDGVLRKRGKTVGYYNTTALSYGLQAGAQSFGYVLFFMSNDSLKYLDTSDGWEIGVGPSVVVLDEGMAKSLTTTTARDDVYAFIFSQTGLMAGLGLQGSKITKIQQDR